MDLKRVFIYNLRNLRKKSGLSQMELSLRCDVSTNYIGEIENGRRFPSVQMIDKIAAVLRIPPYLLFWDEQNKYHRKPASRPNPVIPEEIKQTLVEQVNNTVQKLMREF